MRNTILDAMISDGPNVGKTLGQCILEGSFVSDEVREDTVRNAAKPFLSPESDALVGRLADRIRAGEFEKE